MLDSAPADANLARVPVCDVLHHKLEVGRHNGHHLVKVCPDLFFAPGQSHMLVDYAKHKFEHKL